LRASHKNKQTSENSKIFPLYHSVKEFLDQNLVNGKTEGNTFDLMTFREQSSFDIVDDLGHQKTVQCNERYYAPSEISWLLKTLNYSKIDIYAGQVGDFKRQPLTTENFEMLVIAEK
jgi:hypothetical protein